MKKKFSIVIISVLLLGYLAPFDDSYSVEAKAIDSYSVVGADSAKGVFTEKSQTVTFKYKKIHKLAKMTLKLKGKQINQQVLIRS